MRVLVTGAAGFIGAPLVRALLEGGHEVVGLDHLRTGARDRLPREFELVEGDVRSALLPRAEAVVHLAAVHYIPWCEAHPEETRSINVDGARRAVETGARVLLASTGDVYAPAERPHREDDPLGSPGIYGRTKAEAEELVLAAGGTVARLFNVYGPGETNPHFVPEVLAQLKRDDELVLGNLESRRDYVFLDDVVRAFSLLLEREADVVNVASGRAMSGRELVEQVLELTGRSPRLRAGDPERMRATDRPLLAADLTRMRAVLPEIEPLPLEHGLERTLQAHGLL